MKRHLFLCILLCVQQIAQGSLKNISSLKKITRLALSKENQEILNKFDETRIQLGTALEAKDRERAFNCIQQINAQLKDVSFRNTFAEDKKHYWTEFYRKDLVKKKIKYSVVSPLILQGGAFIIDLMRAMYDVATEYPPYTPLTLISTVASPLIVVGGIALGQILAEEGAHPTDYEHRSACTRCMLKDNNSEGFILKIQKDLQQDIDQLAKIKDEDLLAPDIRTQQEINKEAFLLDARIKEYKEKK